jgi:hypothetical protein
MDRPSVDPELMIRMLIVGYSNSITLEHHAEKWVAVPGNKRCEYKEIHSRSHSGIGSDAVGSRS